MSEDALAVELRRAAAFRSGLRHFLGRTEDVAAAAGLTPQRYNLLLMIKAGRDETSTVTELSQLLGLRQTAVTELVKRAQEAGLVAREPSPTDGRVSVLRLSPEGERRLLRAFVALQDDRRNLARVMSDVDARFRRHAGDDAQH